VVAIFAVVALMPVTAHADGERDAAFAVAISTVEDVIRNWRFLDVVGSRVRDKHPHACRPGHLECDAVQSLIRNTGFEEWLRGTICDLSRLTTATHIGLRARNEKCHTQADGGDIDDADQDEVGRDDIFAHDRSPVW
jgi:hypothetical protein